MKPTDKTPEDDIDTFLTLASRNPPPVPDGLADRINQDAAIIQRASQRRPPTVDGFFSWIDNIVGWRAFAGLTAASCVGFLVGLNAPDGTMGLDLLFPAEGDELYYEATELMGFGWDVQEG